MNQQTDLLYVPSDLNPSNLDAFGNTKLSDMPYDIPFNAYVNGNWVPRFFKTRFCQYSKCDNQIKPKYRPVDGKLMHLTSTSESKKTIYCCKTCANLARRKPKNLDSNNARIKKSMPIQVKISDSEAIVNNWLMGY